MTSTPKLVQATQAIRPYLPELLSPRDAEAMARQLDLALTIATDGEPSQEIMQVLSATEMTRQWLQLYLEGEHSEAEILDIIRTYQPLPGKSGTVASPRYRCPVASCHQVWYRRDVATEVPTCPIHGVVMVRDSKVTSKPT
ncbi:MAG: hypothetical protein ACFBSG_03945 [Leptolyngbyaceae cyanobacterium]